MITTCIHDTLAPIILCLCFIICFVPVQLGASVRLWPKGEIRYRFADKLEQDYTKYKFQYAMDKITKAMSGCITFRELESSDNTGNYLFYEDGPDIDVYSFSEIGAGDELYCKLSFLPGMRDGKRTIRLVYGKCFEIYDIEHLLLQSIGFRVPDKYSLTTAAEEIRRLYKCGQYTDAPVVVTATD
ncbi:Uncharacterised protein g9353 [Pycnogonum litorale]